jgi:membrane protease YdiL (CAAX protease family)
MDILKILKKYQIVTYCVLTFLLTWLFWGILYINPKGMYDPILHKSSFLTLFLLGGTVPCIASVFLTGLFDGKTGIKRLLKKLIIWKVSPFYYLFVLFITIFIIYVPLWICNSTGIHYRFYPNNNVSLVLLNLILVSLYEGPLGEEMGWRGFVLPKLQKKFNPITSSLILGLIWGLWHLPLFFINGDSHYKAPFTLFLIIVVCLSILYTWVYNKTKGSLLLVSLFHGSYNTTLGYVFGKYMPYFIKEVNNYTIILFVTLLVILLIVIRSILKSKESISIAGDFQ